MSSVLKIFKKMRPLELVTFVFYSLLTALILIFNTNIKFWYLLGAANVFIISSMFVLTDSLDRKPGRFWKVISYWYPAPLIFITFKEVYLLVRQLNPHDYDWILIKIDHAIFGVNPTQALYKISNPFLTEVLQIVYSTFYFLPVVLAVSLFLRKKFEEVDFVIYTVVFGYFFSYVGYLLLPAVGPRFTLHNFEFNNIELPGLWAANFIREVINSGESIPSGTPNPMAMVQRDVFPSGHTMMTLMVMYLSIKYKDRTRYLLCIIGSMLIFSTVYLRYHYFVDLLGGTLAMVISMMISKKIYNRIQQK